MRILFLSFSMISVQDAFMHQDPPVRLPEKANKKDDYHYPETLIA